MTELLPAPRRFRAVGLMSGTSMDGIDAAFLVTDGHRVFERGPSVTLPYDAGFRDRLRGVLGGRGAVAAVARELTLLHVEAARNLLKKTGPVDVVGFHGHTILHRPQERRTWQIGEGDLLARELGTTVVDQLRIADVEAGGQGAPLVPAYHAALAADLEKPLAVLNIGGVANVTWIGPDGTLIAFDTGPGNALVDDWMHQRAGLSMDPEGQYGARGRVDEDCLAAMLDHRYFGAKPPKSLDRDDFSAASLGHLSRDDGAATLTAFTAATVARALAHLPAPPKRWIVCGGGRRNRTLMRMLADRLAPAVVEPVERVGWDGDAVEAEAFAFLAVRSLLGLPITFPGTTGARRPLTGGQTHEA